MEKKQSLKQKAIVVYSSFYYPVFKILGKIISVILVIIIIIASVIIFLDKANIIGYAIYTVESESMQPTIMKGDIVIVKKETAYNVEDIITFYPTQTSKTTYTHRIVKIESDKYFTKGDNNTVQDPYSINIGAIEGKVERVIPQIGYVLLFMRSVMGIILLIIIPVTVLLTLNMQSFYNYLKLNSGK